MSKKKWYESGWVWAGAGLGLYIFLRAKKAAAAIPPPWNPAECSPITTDIQPYINKFREAANNVYGPGSAGEVCVTLPDINLQIGTESISMDLSTLKAQSIGDLTETILNLERQ